MSSSSSGRQYGKSCERGRPPGFSLVEVMVALFIGSLILIAVVKVYSSSRATYQTDEGMARLQENARFAMDIVTREIRAAGYMGCNKKVPINNYLAGSPPAFVTDIPIQGFEYTGTGPGSSYTLPSMTPTTLSSTTTDWSPALDTSLLPAAVPGSDIIVLRHMDSDPTTLTGPVNDSASVFVDAPASINKGQVLLLTDCARSSLFQATSISAGASSGKITVTHSLAGGGISPGNVCAVWGTTGGASGGGCPQYKSYDPGAQIATFKTTIFYVGKSTANGGGPALYVRTFDTGVGVSQELVDGIENIQLLYGIGASSGGKNAEQYVTAAGLPLNASGAPDWNRVRSVRLGLLVATRNITGQAEMAADTQSYAIDGVSVIAPGTDRLRRRVFMTTVDLRNN